MALEREELAGWLRLALTPGIGNAAARKLLAAFGLPPRIFEQSMAALGASVSGKQAAALQQVPPELADLLETTWQWLQADLDARRVLTDIQEDGNALQFDGAFKRYVKTEEFDEDKPNGYGKFKVFWLKRKK